MAANGDTNTHTHRQTDLPDCVPKTGNRKFKAMPSKWSSLQGWRGRGGDALSRDCLLPVARHFGLLLLLPVPHTLRTAACAVQKFNYELLRNFTCNCCNFSLILLNSCAVSLLYSLLLLLLLPLPMSNVMLFQSYFALHCSSVLNANWLLPKRPERSSNYNSPSRIINSRHCCCNKLQQLQELRTMLLHPQQPKHIGTVSI